VRADSNSLGWLRVPEIVKKLRPDALTLAETEQDEERDLRFELAFLRSLTTGQRFNLMFGRSRQMADSLRAHGRAEAESILQRP